MDRTYYENHLSNYTEHSKRKFKDFAATLTEYPDISILDWKNRNGSSEYSMRVIFDEDRCRMFISGDLGEAVFNFTEKATLFRIASYSSLSYFMEKLSCSTNKWEYHKEAAKAELEEHLICEDMSMSDEDLEETKELIDDIMSEYDQYGKGTHLTDEITDRLSDIDPDYWEWVYSLGELPHARVIIWWQALKLAAKQLRTKENG